MPKGFSGVRQASAQLKAKRDAAGGFAPPALYFSLDDGDSAIVRFLEQDDDISWCWVHEIPVEGRSWGREVPCLDQDDEDEACPGCEKEMKRKVKGYINLIWEDAPLYKKDGEGKLVKDGNGNKKQIGSQDQVALWSSGIRLFEDLDELNETFKGLKSRKFRVKRKGVKLNTKYTIQPAYPDEDKEERAMDRAEKKLEEGKYDLNDFMKIPEYDEFVNIMNGGTGSTKSSGSDDDPVKKAKKNNPFMRSRS